MSTSEASGSAARVLLVEDVNTLALTYQGYLAKDPYAVTRVDCGKDALAELQENPPDVVLLDLMLPDMDGLDILAWIREQGMTCAVIIITAHGSIDVAVSAMRQGAFDFLEKPFTAERLRMAIASALTRKQFDPIGISEDAETRTQYQGFVGASQAMRNVYRTIDNAAPSRASVFITGESGTGKEVCAEALHYKSPRAEKAFVALNCAAIPRDLMESEVFGHVKGAFTGAVGHREGAAARANGGTLFLDEIAEMNLDLQAKLLRFIQTGSFQKVGSSKTETVDVRFICATNKDPMEMVRAGRFREDLYYRLHVIPLHLPPLRDRGEDVVQIAKHFLRLIAEEEGKEFQRFDDASLKLLRRYPWPGNVRELLNVVRNVVVLHSGQEVRANMFPPPLNDQQGRFAHPSIREPLESGDASAGSSPVEPMTSSGIRPLWIVEREAIEQAIDACDGNIPRAAALLEISASTVYRKLQTWKDIDEGKGSPGEA
ncbi:MAG: sigma-54-dependent Fis family transcriptional regulator [Gammaproteobacteria bacterium]|nr:sigma-54-dependent Fis family transcriptional regulator [Gammaproteobacteria bacterium]MCP5135527.1 sigma-54-dependent Fis family transcriptional regulator [Gammaproteobacteria bacterium]